MSRKMKRSVVKSQHELEIRRAKEAKEKLAKKRENRKATQAKTGVKKLSSKVLRRIKARKEQNGDDESDKDEGEETIMETE
ncbi:hypothetical protein H310_06500 [Aphanomyces invadans]|uniref:Uncharacterized protein n=1 Tax=Aphanomyces invadans TaxID=157072 RepID=A0A024U6T5_9STRA|nr:hypothetical protein H310_06500 [Aphanomyces invadans]ETW01974.1 hypothetical protein H310_06500 [Aphanomyces invadans]|eukprot:XP_008869822.1 hypothetical protein H310_06500 [Aphanomyces invadans]